MYLDDDSFEQFQIYEDIFGFLFNITKLKSLDDDSLQKDRKSVV